jgi:hypothetical protein
LTGTDETINVAAGDSLEGGQQEVVESLPGGIRADLFVGDGRARSSVRYFQGLDKLSGNGAML